MELDGAFPSSVTEGIPGVLLFEEPLCEESVNGVIPSFILRTPLLTPFSFFDRLGAEGQV